MFEVIDGLRGVALLGRDIVESGGDDASLPIDPLLNFEVLGVVLDGLR
jgi:hypothetical protein